MKDWAEHIGSAWRYLSLAWKEAKSAEPSKEEKKELSYTATPTGAIQGSMSVKEAVEAMVRRKRREQA